MANKNIAVKILGKDYQVACPEEQVHSLIDAALLLDGKMKEVKASGRVIGLDRIAVITALNLAHELLIRQESELRLIAMYDKLEEALEETA